MPCAPHRAIKKYIGTNIISQKKNRNISIVRNTPITQSSIQQQVQAKETLIFLDFTPGAEDCHT
jgi:hypothetical protein